MIYGVWKEVKERARDVLGVGIVVGIISLPTLFDRKSHFDSYYFAGELKCAPGYHLSVNVRMNGTNAYGGSIGIYNSLINNRLEILAQKKGTNWVVTEDRREKGLWLDRNANPNLWNNIFNEVIKKNVGKSGE